MTEELCLAIVYKDYAEAELIKERLGYPLDDHFVYIIFVDEEPVSWVRLPKELSNKTVDLLALEFTAKHMLFTKKGVMFKPVPQCSKQSLKKIEDIKEFLYSKIVHDFFKKER